MHKLANYCRGLLEKQVEEEDLEEAATASGAAARRPMRSGEVIAGGEFVKESLKSDQEAAAKKINRKLDAARQELLSSLKDEYSVAPDQEDFHEALGGRAPVGGSVSVKRKRAAEDEGAQRQSAGKKFKR
mmetsp:Transcript_31484/g.57364  ORF Transcript_31484/g.57364 Transcript_31484/m.57364 type:complete len:130 (+) Transcript_31484:2-391(+)